VAPTDKERAKKRKEMDLDGDGTITPQERQLWKASQPDTLSKKELASRYDFALSVIYSNDELRKLFEQAMNAKKGQWTADKFKAELRNTKWWKNGKYWRSAYISQKEGVEWKNDMAGATKAVRDRATSLGVTLNDNQLKRLATRFLYEGWYDGPRQSFLDEALARFIGDKSVGTEDYQAQLRSLAWNYGVEKVLDDAWYVNAQKRLARGETTIDALSAEIREKAKSKYAPLAGAIDNGETTRSALKGYTTAMADLLELDESKIDIDDPLLKRAWAANNGPDGTPSTMTLYDFEREVRRDERWKSTKNGRKSTVNLAQSFLRSLGFQE
jgi:hypothetical protein